MPAGPFDRERDGFVLGEGAGILVLEEYDHAKARGASIYCEILGYGQSADAYDLVAPDPEGKGVGLAFRRALDQRRNHARRRGLHQRARHVDANGRSCGIACHRKDLWRTRDAQIGVSSTKSMHGHALGAAGGIEGVATALAVQNDLMPPTINYEFPDPECRLDYVPNVARRAPIRVALSNSFGFGGHNSVIVFGKVRP